MEISSFQILSEMILQILKVTLREFEFSNLKCCNFSQLKVVTFHIVSTGKKNVSDFWLVFVANLEVSMWCTI